MSNQSKKKIMVTKRKPLIKSKGEDETNSWNNDEVVRSSPNSVMGDSTQESGMNESGSLPTYPNLFSETLTASDTTVTSKEILPSEDKNLEGKLLEEKVLNHLQVQDLKQLDSNKGETLEIISSKSVIPKKKRGRKPKPKTVNLEITNNGITNKITNKITNGITNDVHNDVSNDINNDVSNDISNDVNNDISNDISNDVNNDISNEISNEKKVLKKRGRKPKVKTIIDSDSSSLSVSNSGQVKKRGRKPRAKSTYSLLDFKPNNKSTNAFEKESYIICLKITSEDLYGIVGFNKTTQIEKEMSVSIPVPSPSECGSPGHPGPTGITALSKGKSEFNNSNVATSDNSVTKHTSFNTINLLNPMSSVYDGECLEGSKNYCSEVLPWNNNRNTDISKELAFYLENHFNNMYSFPNTIPNNYKPVMPLITPEKAEFDYKNGSYCENKQAMVSSNFGGDSSQSDKPSFLNSSSLKNLTQIDLSSQVMGQWINRRVDDILPAFRDKEQTWPQQSPYDCWNCAERFDGPPIGIPDHIEGEIDALDMEEMKFYLYGNFCNFSCAARYLFDTTKDSSIWEKYSLLNILHSKIFKLGKITRVQLAPEKILLKKFGGYLSIEKYRMNHLGNKEYQIFKPPMIPILFQMEESVNDRNMQRSRDQIIPMDTDKVEKKLKLRRLKPVRNNTLTIDQCMNMQVKVL